MREKLKKQFGIGASKNGQGGNEEIDNEDGEEEEE
jgi:hypothetical protein